MTQLTILIACEESQAECMAFRELGHEAYSCDIQPCRQGGHPEWHIHGDVLPILDGLVDFLTQDNTPHHIEHWDIIIAHPPCTYLCRVQMPLLKPKGQIDPVRFCQMKMARDFFFPQLPQPSCYIQPSWFGVKYTKKTLYWLKNLPPIMPTKENSSPKQFVRSSRGKYRSRTFPEVARALAEQWSKYVIEDLERRHLKALRTILEPTLPIGTNTFD